MRNRFYCAKTGSKNIDSIIQEHVMSKIQKDRVLWVKNVPRKSSLVQVVDVLFLNLSCKMVHRNYGEYILFPGL